MIILSQAVKIVVVTKPPLSLIARQSIAVQWWISAKAMTGRRRCVPMGWGWTRIPGSSLAIGLEPGAHHGSMFRAKRGDRIMVLLWDGPGLAPLGDACIACRSVGGVFWRIGCVTRVRKPGAAE